MLHVQLADIATETSPNTTLVSVSGMIYDETEVVNLSLAQASCPVFKLDHECDSGSGHKHTQAWSERGSNGNRVDWREPKIEAAKRKYAHHKRCKTDADL